MKFHENLVYHNADGYYFNVVGNAYKLEFAPKDSPEFVITSDGKDEIHSAVITYSKRTIFIMDTTPPDWVRRGLSHELFHAYYTETCLTGKKNFSMEEMIVFAEKFSEIVIRQVDEYFKKRELEELNKSY